MACYTQSVKRRKVGVDDFTTTSNLSKHCDEKSTQNIIHHKIPIPSIELITFMWFGLPIHETMATKEGTKIIKKKRAHERYFILRYSIK